MLIYGQPSYTRCVSFEAAAAMPYSLYRCTSIELLHFREQPPMHVESADVVCPLMGKGFGETL